ncbi:sin3 histone deacetylase corepressor complex component SDS3-like [Oppia nitens]|uniref:sin3 histone deacetylase corepressor complex component SDS3-like n=1 Tax=Oppia nitens TaxID=1686743 RepID=UPI0023D9914D|nr:sin3 histone deacetylase corepressor complex component SDS3-like [Oppia nitens]
MSEYDCEDDLSADYNDLYEVRDSDEDTEDASETDVVLKYDNTDNEYTEIKEQMYRDKLATLKDQLNQLEAGLHPEYKRRIAKLLEIHEERKMFSEVFVKFENERIEREYFLEKRSAAREFEERKIELKESLIIELEDKKKMVESERITLELTNDSVEPKPLTTRKLRRRPNEPIPIPEKRRRASPAQLNLLLEDSDINEDLKILSRCNNNAKLSATTFKKFSIANMDMDSMAPDAKIEDGKLFYDKKWFHRGQNVFIESSNDTKFNAILVQIGTSEIWIKKPNETIKSKISLSDLHNGKYSLFRRSS